jgi:hypothetical protein
MTVQVMRRYGVPEPYEKLKAFTRGQKVTQHSMQVSWSLNAPQLCALDVQPHSITLQCTRASAPSGADQHTLWVQWPHPYQFSTSPSAPKFTLQPLLAGVC